MQTQNTQNKPTHHFNLSFLYATLQSNPPSPSFLFSFAYLRIIVPLALELRQVGRDAVRDAVEEDGDPVGVA